jgi:hypothetical protein
MRSRLQQANRQNNIAFAIGILILLGLGLVRLSCNGVVEDAPEDYTGGYKR